MQTTIENHTISGTTSLKLGDRKAEIARIADYRKRSVHSLLIEAVDEFIVQEKEKMEFERQAIQAYKDFQETGMGISLDDYSAWVDSLSTENPLPFPQPKCQK